MPTSDKLIYVVGELWDSEVLPCNGLENSIFMVEFEHFKVGISTWKFTEDPILQS